MALVLLTLFVLGRIQIFQLDAIHGFPDTVSYVRVAAQPLMQRAFWAGERPLTLPLMYKLLGVTGPATSVPDGAARIALFQLCVSVLSWIALAGAFASGLRRPQLKVLGVAVILAVGMTMEVGQWDKLLLTESLSTSLFAAMLALWLVGVLHWEKVRSLGPLPLLAYLGLTGAVTGLYSFTRDTNAYFLLLVAMVLLGLAAVRLKWDSRSLGVTGLAVMLVFIFLIQNKTASAGRRWIGPFRHVFLKRILPNDAALAFFREQGLPLTADQRPGLLSMDIRTFNRVLDNSALVKPLNGWLSYYGKGVYLKFLVSHPIYTVLSPLYDWQQLISPNSTEYRTILRATPKWEETLSAVLFPTSALVVAGLGISTFLYTLLAWRRRHDRTLVIPGLLFLTCLPLLGIVWHADTLEIERHATQIALQIRLAVWMTLLIGADRALLARFPRSDAIVDPHPSDADS